MNGDILNCSGATLSSKAIARGVRKAIALFHHFYGSGAGREVSLGTKPPRAPKELINTRRRVRDAADVGANVHYIQARYLMGTVCAVELYAPNRERAERAANAAFDAMRHVERRMSSYLPESELSRLNRNAGAGNPVEVSKELFEVLDFARRVSEASDGAFDITVAPLLRTWGFLPAFAEGGMGDGESDDEPSFASRRERPPVRATVGYRKIRLNPRTRTVQFMRPGIEIDLGGIAKGYAVDKAIEALRGQGIRRARISTGGSTLYALGTPPDQPAGWSIMLPTGETLPRPRCGGFKFRAFRALCRNLRPPLLPHLQSPARRAGNSRRRHGERSCASGHGIRCPDQAVLHLGRAETRESSQTLP